MSFRQHRVLLRFLLGKKQQHLEGGAKTLRSRTMTTIDELFLLFFDELFFFSFFLIKLMNSSLVLNKYCT